MSRPQPMTPCAALSVESDGSDQCVSIPTLCENCSCTDFSVKSEQSSATDSPIYGPICHLPPYSTQRLDNVAQWLGQPCSPNPLLLGRYSPISRLKNLQSAISAVEDCLPTEAKTGGKRVSDDDHLGDNAESFSERYYQPELSQSLRQLLPSPPAVTSGHGWLTPTTPAPASAAIQGFDRRLKDSKVYTTPSKIAQTSRKRRRLELRQAWETRFRLLAVDLLHQAIGHSTLLLYSFSTETLILPLVVVQGICCMLAAYESPRFYKYSSALSQRAANVPWDRLTSIPVFYLQGLYQLAERNGIDQYVTEAVWHLSSIIKGRKKYSIQDSVSLLRSANLMIRPTTIAALFLTWLHYWRAKTLPASKTNARKSPRVSKACRTRKSNKSFEKTIIQVLSFGPDFPSPNVQVGTSASMKDVKRGRWACYLHKHDPQKYTECNGYSTETERAIRAHLEAKHSHEQCFEWKSVDSHCRGDDDLTKWRKTLISMFRVYKEHLSELNPWCGQDLLHDIDLATQLRVQQELDFTTRCTGSGSLPTGQESSFQATVTPLSPTTTATTCQEVQPMNEFNQHTGPACHNNGCKVESGKLVESTISQTLNELANRYKQIVSEEEDFGSNGENMSSALRAKIAALDLLSNVSLASDRALKSFLGLVAERPIMTSPVTGYERRGSTSCPIQAIFDMVRTDLKVQLDKVEIYHHEFVLRYRQRLRTLEVLNCVCLCTERLNRLVEELVEPRVNLTPPVGKGGEILDADHRNTSAIITPSVTTQSDWTRATLERSPASTETVPTVAEEDGCTSSYPPLPELTGDCLDQFLIDSELDIE